MLDNGTHSVFFIGCWYSMPCHEPFLSHSSLLTRSCQMLLKTGIPLHRVRWGWFPCHSISLILMPTLCSGSFANLIVDGAWVCLLISIRFNIFQLDWVQYFKPWAVHRQDLNIWKILEDCIHDLQHHSYSSSVHILCWAVLLGEWRPNQGQCRMSKCGFGAGVRLN